MADIDQSVNVKFIADMQNLQSALSDIQNDMQSWKTSTESILDDLNDSMDSFAAGFERAMLRVIIGGRGIEAVFRMVHREILDVMENINSIPNIPADTVDSVNRMNMIFSETGQNIKEATAATLGFFGKVLLGFRVLMSDIESLFSSGHLADVSDLYQDLTETQKEQASMGLDKYNKALAAAQEQYANALEKSTMAGKNESDQIALLRAKYGELEAELNQMDMSSRKYTLLKTEALKALDEATDKSIALSVSYQREKAREAEADQRVALSKMDETSKIAELRAEAQELNSEVEDGLGPSENNLRIERDHIAAKEKLAEADKLELELTNRINDAQAHYAELQDRLTNASMSSGEKADALHREAQSYYEQADAEEDVLKWLELRSKGLEDEIRAGELDTEVMNRLAEAQRAVADAQSKGVSRTSLAGDTIDEAKEQMRSIQAQIAVQTMMDDSSAAGKEKLIALNQQLAQAVKQVNTDEHALFEDAQKWIKESETDTDRYMQQLEQISVLEKDQKLTDEQAGEARIKAWMTTDFWGKTITSDFNTFTDSLVKGISTGKNFEDTFRKATNTMIQQIEATILKMAILETIMGAIGLISPVAAGAFGQVSGLSNMNGTTTTAAPVPNHRASGGPVGPNTPYMVGESGPEMFIPGSSGYIQSNQSLNEQSAGSVNQTLNISTGVAQTVRAEMKSMMPLIQRQTMAAVMTATKRGGSYQKALRGT